MAEYKLVQKLYPGVHPWKEIFYDGQVEVVDNTVIVNKEHWRDELVAWRGFEEVSMDTSSPDAAEAPKQASRRSGGRKKTAPSTSAPEERTQGDA